MEFEKDSLFDDAAELVVRHQSGSTSLLQRYLKLGYMRAGRIMQQLEESGIVGEFHATIPRTVLFKDAQSLKSHLDNL